MASARSESARSESAAELGDMRSSLLSTRREAEAAITAGQGWADVGDAVHLPAYWTSIDQEIMESLLFDQPVARCGDGATSLQQAIRYRALLAKQTASEKRKSKHREVQRRFMQRKKEQIGRAKQLVARLEKEYKVLELANEHKRLCDENAAMEKETATRKVVTLPTQEQIDRVLVDQQKLIRESFVPLTDDDWDELLRKNLGEFEASRCETEYESTGAVVLGWSDRRKIDLQRGTTRFVMSKRFPHLNALDFRDTTWFKLCQPETHPQLFNPGVTLKMQVLQRSGEDAVVLHRCLFNPLTGAVVHSIESMMRVTHSRSPVIFLRTLEYNAAYECVPKSHKWMQIFTALVFTPVSAPAPTSSKSKPSSSGEAEPGCMFRYAGCLRDLPRVEVRYWLMEMLYVILRFESVMVAPVFAVRAE